ncbi:MAG TPA: CHAD domain-containing protein [Steroidobacteraceae bacterium]|nr:CHAD domain-containing protein [Steroidobacteraceae bacterium]
MGTEVELKLSIPAAEADKVRRLQWLRELSGPARCQQLVTVYFDTSKFELRERGVAIRVRRAGRRRLQAIKALGADGRAPFGRYEWEQEITGDTPDLKLAHGTALEPLATKKLRRRLKPIFETVIERTTFPIHSEKADLELALDRGHIRVHGSREREPISEIEIEVKRGDPVEIAKLAKRLARSLSVTYGPRSKAERGYALSADEAGKGVRGAAIALDPRVSAGDAFRIIGLACLDHAIANERATREGDAEGIHQMRVGLRRLRTAISIFKDLVHGPETEAIKTELKWLTDQLAAARDLDVLIEKQLRPLRNAAPIGAAAAVLEQDLDARRAAELAKAKAAVESERYRSGGLRTALWLAEGSWLGRDDPARAALRERPAAQLAAETLGARTKKMLKKARRVGKLDARARHRLRIGVKKLRYACEFFAGLFPGPKQSARRERFCKALRALQGLLGELNDFEVHKDMAAQIARPRKDAHAQARKALAMGFITGREQKQLESCVAAIDKTVVRLAKLPGFWK